MKKVVCFCCGFGCKFFIDFVIFKVKLYKGELNKGKFCFKGLYFIEIVKFRDRFKRLFKCVGLKIVLISWG